MPNINLPLYEISKQQGKTVKNLIYTYLKVYLVVLVVTLLLSLLLNSTLWQNNIKFIHTFLELTGIFVVLSTFFVVWFTYELTPLPNQLIGFGFLTSASFYLLHTYFFYYGDLSTINLNLAVAFYLLGRMLETGILFALSWKKIQLRVNKKTCLLLTALLTVGLPILFINYPHLLPDLIVVQGVTPLKKIFELMIISLITLTLFNFKYRNTNSFPITYEYIFMALLFSIPSELCFTLFQDSYSLYKIWGHILKIPYYIFLFRAIFISSITYPYEKLKRSNIYITDLFNKLPSGLINFTPDYRLSFANSQALKLLECTQDSIQGLSKEQLITMLFPGKNKKERKKLNLVTDILTIKTCQGNVKKLKINNYRLENNEYIWILNEASKEQELTNLQLQTDTILNSINNLVLLINNNDQIIMYNNAFKETLELDDSQIKGAGIIKLNKLLNLNMEEIHRKTKHGDIGEESYYEISCNTARGKLKDLLVHLAPITNVEEEIIGIIYIGSDITDLKKEQQKLIQQEKLALLGQLGASIVHETKNYLATIKGSSQLLNILTDPDKIKKYARTIDQATDEVSRIINHFLSLSRPRQPELKEVSLNQLLKSMENMIKTPSLINGIETNINLSSEEKQVICDENQIKQVILNVWQNAVDAVAEVNKPVINISTELKRNKEEMILTISDNGKGICNAEKDKIGTPFYTTKNKGTGLGLSVCYHIMKDNAGRIEFISEKGEGTKFSIYLPVKKDT